MNGMEQSSVKNKAYGSKSVIPVVLQIFLFALPFLLAGGVFMWLQSRKMFEEERLESGKTLLMEASVIEAVQLDWEMFGRTETDKAYFEERISGIRTQEGSRARLLYGYFGMDKDGVFRILDMGAGDGREPEWISRCVQEGEGACVSYGEGEENCLALYTPVFSPSGRIAGVVKCSLETESFLAGSREMSRMVSRSAMICFSVIILAIMGMLAIFLRPVRQLKFFLREVGEQGKAIHLRGRGRNEISELLEILSRMSENIHEYMSQVKRLQDQYRAFVPRELVSLLGKSDIRQVKAGDLALCEGTLAVINMGAFAGLQTNCGAEELFERINFGLARMIPEIEENNGQILRFFQGGLLALFPGSGGQAVACVGRILQKLRLQAKDTYYAALDYRKIHLELAGDDSRLQFTVRGKDWEDIRSLARLAQKHGLAMVGGAGLGQKLKEEHSPLFARSLGWVVRGRDGGGAKSLEGAGETMELIEFSAGEKETAARLMKETAGIFEQGIREFYRGRFRESRECFGEILRKNHQDRAAQRYFALCDQRLWGDGQGERPCFDWIESY